MTPERTKATEMAGSKDTPFPWRCPECGKKEVRPATVAHTSQITHDGRFYTVEISRLGVPRCGACGELVFDNDADVPRLPRTPVIYHRKSLDFVMVCNGLQYPAISSQTTKLPNL